MDSAALIMLNEQQFYLFGQARDQPYSAATPFDECSLGTKKDQ